MNVIVIPCLNTKMTSKNLKEKKYVYENALFILINLKLVSFITAIQRRINRCFYIYL